MSSLDFVKSNDVELAWVDGEIVMEEDTDMIIAKDTEKIEDPEKVKGTVNVFNCYFYKILARTFNLNLCLEVINTSKHL